MAKKLKTYPTFRQAQSAAERCGMPNLVCSAEKTDDGEYIPVALLRSDQHWVIGRLTERGVLTKELET